LHRQAGAEAGDGEAIERRLAERSTNPVGAEEPVAARHRFVPGLSGNRG